MPKQTPIYFDPQSHRLIASGEWDVNHLPALQALLAATQWPASGEIHFNGEAITKMDSAGAWLINEWKQKQEQKGLKITFEHMAPQQEKLLGIINAELESETPIPTVTRLSWLFRVGKNTTKQLDEFQQYLAFIGGLTVEALRIVLNPIHWRWSSLASVIYRNGYDALPIIALLSFMIGVVITYQMGLQLRSYGANIYIVDLLGLSVLREFGPLLTAIMVAGRTGSAFTAQLGMMKLNQEIDALDTMGVTPAELLILPRIIGLFIALPLLTMWSDIWGVFGGMVMANNMLSITWYDFLHRFPNVIPLRALLIGLGKAPVFALIIASIGCYQGVKVEGGAESIGRNTTRSVVLAIFFIMVADAIFSVIFSKMKL